MSENTVNYSNFYTAKTSRALDNTPIDKLFTFEKGVRHDIADDIEYENFDVTIRNITIEGSSATVEAYEYYEYKLNQLEEPSSRGVLYQINYILQDDEWKIQNITTNNELQMDGVGIDGTDNRSVPAPSEEITPEGAAIYTAQFTVDTYTADAEGWNTVGTTNDYTANTLITLDGAWSDSGATVTVLLENIDDSSSAFVTLSNRQPAQSLIATDGRYKIRMKSNVPYVYGTLQITANP